MLKRKMFRDICQNKSQFLTIFLTLTIGVMVYSGISVYMDGMTTTSSTYYENNNLQDLNCIGQNFTKDDLNSIKNTKYVVNAERKLELNMVDNSDDNKSYLVSVIEANDISKFHVSEGKAFDLNKKGVWIDYFFAKENNIKVNDEISFKYDNYVFNEKVNGIIYVPDHVYDVKDASQIMPNHQNYGIIYMSVIELKDYITNLTKENLSLKLNQNLTDEKFSKLMPNFNYLDYIPFNYIMVDVDNKKNVEAVKNNIEENVDNVITSIAIEKTAGYKMFQGEIDEGKAYIGIFSGLFLFIALLTVITTMRRVVKRQKIQIGTLKSLGFSKNKIIMHYVSYGLLISLLSSLCGLLLGKYFLGSMFLGIEMSFFEMPGGKTYISLKSIIMALLVVLIVSFITYLTTHKELKTSPAESLKKEVPKVNSKSLNITTSKIFQNRSFATIWNLRDILRNKFRTLTAVVGTAGSTVLIVCALGMLGSINHFIELQFEDLYNFDYKLTLKDNLSENDLKELTTRYGDNTSKTLNIEVSLDDKEEENTIFVDNSNNFVRFVDKNEKFMGLTSSDGLYVTKKYASENNIQVGDKISWHIIGSKEVYESRIVGIYKDPEVQGFSATKDYLESLSLKYTPDALYTNKDLSKTKNIKNVLLIQNKDELKDAIGNMLGMMKQMVVIIIVIAVILGVVIIYNMSILSYSEKEYQFATLSVLGFSTKQIQTVFNTQNSWITIVACLIGLPLGYLLTSYLFAACLDETYDFSVYITPLVYFLAAFGTYLVSYLVTKYISQKIKKIDMVSSLKMNE